MLHDFSEAICCTVLNRFVFSSIPLYPIIMYDVEFMQ